MDATVPNLRLATFIGMGALFLWIIEPLVVSELVGFPLFEALTLVFLSCFILTATRITITKRWGLMLKQPLFVWLFGTVAICGSDFTYMLGAHCAPIAHVDLIDYMWPCIIVLVIGFLPGEKFSLRYLIGAILGVIGVFYLLCTGEDAVGFNHNYLGGYIVAFYGVLLWGSYSVYTRFKRTIPSDMVGVYCGLGALVTWCLHCYYETTVIPNFNQAGLAIMLGLAGPGLAYQLWDVGMRFGNAKWLNVACYFARVAAMSLLVLFGKEPFSSSLVIAVSLTVLGVFICSVDESFLKRFYFWQR